MTKAALARPPEARPPEARLPVWRTVRFRLLLLALLPVMVVLPLLLGGAALNWSRRFDEALIAKVNGELTIAHQHLERLMQSRLLGLEALAGSARFERQIADPLGLEGFLEAERARLGLDFLHMVQGDQVIAAAPAGSGQPRMRPRWPIITQALAAGQPAVAIDLFQADDLAAISPDLAVRARLSLIDTPAAQPTTRTEETRGLVVHAAAPAAGGALVGGVLLNRNLGFIDEINDLVYPSASLTEGSQGTATLFLEDVRVSTNVRMFDDERALGTRVSAAVRARVLAQGQVWLNRAFVVNNWYVSAYEPIVDSNGARIGMLYVGFLEAPFSAAKARTLLQIGAGFIASLVVLVPLLLFWARSVFRPLERMNRTISAVEGGDLGARTDARGAEDEIARLAAHLDTLLDRLQDRDRALRGWAEELESRVDDRTRALRDANEKLRIATSQLVLSEKLAAIGEITAGVAHEINNPVAVIQGNMDLIQSELGPRAAEFATEFRLIQDQIQTINILVSKLLQFARPEEYADVGQPIDPAKTVRDTLPLVQHHLHSGHIRLDLHLRAAPQVQLPQTELQQVLVNLIANAVQAMPEGGTVTLRTGPAMREGVSGAEICVCDTGSGIPADVLGRVFDPFFTTKRGRGTGLGLSVSHEIVRRAGGAISVTPLPGAGSSFSVWLPAAGKAGTA